MKFNPEALEAAMQAKDDMTVELLAGLSGVSYQTVYRAVRGLHEPAGGAVVAMAGVLDVDVATLYTENGAA